MLFTSLLFSMALKKELVPNLNPGSKQGLWEEAELEKAAALTPGQSCCLIGSQLRGAHPSSQGKVGNVGQ